MKKARQNGTVGMYAGTCRGVGRVQHMGPRPQPQRLCPLKFDKLALGAATLSRNRLELPHPKIVLVTPLAGSRIPLIINFS